MVAARDERGGPYSVCANALLWRFGVGTSSARAFESSPTLRVFHFILPLCFAPSASFTSPIIYPTSHKRTSESQQTDDVNKGRLTSCVRQCFGKLRPQIASAQPSVNPTAKTEVRVGRQKEGRRNKEGPEAGGGESEFRGWAAPGLPLPSPSLASARP